MRLHTPATSAHDMRRVKSQQMSVLTLKSVVDSSSALLLCNLTVTNLNDEVISSRRVNFSDGSTIVINFHDSGDDEDILDDWVNVSISDCTALNQQEVDVTSSSNRSLYVADPCSFVYRISFLDNDPSDFDDLSSEPDASSRLIFLAIEGSHDYLQSKTLDHNVDANDFTIHEAIPSRANDNLKPFSISSDQPSMVSSYAPRSIKIDYIIKFAKVLGACEDSNLSFQVLIFNIWLIFIVGKVITYMKKLVQNSTGNGQSTVELSGSHDMMTENRAMLYQWKTNHSQGKTNWDSSLVEEYYKMIENATGNVALDYMSYGNDTESESEFLTTVDTRNTTANAAQFEESSDSVDMMMNSTDFLPSSATQELLIGSDNVDRVPTSIDTVERAFLAGEQWLRCINP